MFRKALAAGLVTATVIAGAATAQSQLAGSLTAEMLEDAPIVSLEGTYDASIWDNTAPLNAMVADLTEIGDVENILLDERGTVLGVTTDVGGFLGIGENTVLIPLADIRLARASADSDDVTVVTRLNREQIESLTIFED